MPIVAPLPLLVLWLSWVRAHERAHHSKNKISGQSQKPIVLVNDLQGADYLGRAGSDKTAE